MLRILSKSSAIASHHYTRIYPNHYRCAFFSRLITILLYLAAHHPQCAWNGWFNFQSMPIPLASGIILKLEINFECFRQQHNMKTARSIKRWLKAIFAVNRLQNLRVSWLEFKVTLNYKRAFLGIFRSAWRTPRSPSTSSADRKVLEIFRRATKKDIPPPRMLRIMLEMLQAKITEKLTHQKARYDDTNIQILVYLQVNEYHQVTNMFDETTHPCSGWCEYKQQYHTYERTRFCNATATENLTRSKS